NDNQLIVGNVGAFVTNRLENALVYDDLSSTWSLSRNVELFTFQLTAPSATNDLRLDFLSGQIAVAGAPVPEPSSLTLAVIGTLGAFFYLRTNRAIRAYRDGPAGVQVARRENSRCSDEKRI